MAVYNKKHLFLLLLVWLYLFPEATTTAQEPVKFAVIGYFMGHGNEASLYPVEKLTHIIYSFLHLQGNQLLVTEKDSASITSLVQLKKRNPALKVIVSLGGWGGCRSCPEIFSSDKGRVEFAASTLRVFEKYKVDGLDLDWEYPALASVPGYPYSKEDKHNFTLLIHELRKAVGMEYELSFAAGGFSEFFENSIEWDLVMPELNYVNLMTYDIVNGYSKSTGHHTPLFSTSSETNSADFAVRYLDSLGVERSKMIVGAAFYARVFKDVPAVNHGLYQSGSFSEYINFRDLSSKLSSTAGYEEFWDDVAKAPYAYNLENHLFATFDNARSIELKSRYVMEHKLGGIMFWCLNSDTYQDGLLDVINKVRNED